MSRNSETGKEIKRLIDTILLSEDEKMVEKALGELGWFQVMASSKGVRKVLSGFLKSHSDFRSHLYYPSLNLPITSNSMESLVELIRHLQYKARGFRGIKSLNQWVVALCKYKKKIACNGRNYQPN